MIPVIGSLKATHPDLLVVRRRIITYLAALVLMFIMAPIFLPVVLVPRMGSIFRRSLKKSFLSDQE